MRCPNDNSKLIIKSKEGLVSYCCPTCSGIYLNRKGVNAFKHNFGSEILDQLFKSKVLEHSKINCSHCNNQMHLTKIDSIELDICTTCHSIWFDQHEVSQLITSYRSTPSELDSFGVDSIVTSFLPFPLAILYSIGSWIIGSDSYKTLNIKQEPSGLNKHQEQSLIDKNRNLF